jgi:putative phage-type endonuclease
MQLVSLDQRSPEWLAWRQAGLGSTSAPVIMGRSKWTTKEELWLEKVQAVHRELPEWVKLKLGEKKGGTRNTSSMRRGQDLEPKVRDLHEQWVGVRCDPVCAVHSEYSWLKASLDGYSASHRIVLEIKCPNADDHGAALRGKVPRHYQDQVDHLLLVTGAEQLHYCSYSPRFGVSMELAVVRVFPDPRRLEKLLQAEKQFWTDVLTLTFP